MSRIRYNALVAAALSIVLAASGGVDMASASGQPRSATPFVGDPVSKVDPFIGSSNGGNTWPGATMPFGMMAWSPTGTSGDQTNSPASNGYSYDVNRLRGFSLTHVNGAGCAPGAAGDVPIMPFAGEVTTSPTADTTDSVYSAGYSHTDESASPGRYTVTLDSGIRSDLAVSTRAGVSDFTFPADKPANLLFRTSNSINGSEQADTTIDPATRTVTGSVLTGGFCSRRGNGGGVTNPDRRSYYRVYFSASFDRDFARTGTWQDSTVTPGGTSASGGEGYLTGADRAGRGSGGWVGFDTAQSREVHLRIGVSYVSIAGASANRDAEIPRSASVDSIAKAGAKSWNRELSRVKVAGGTPERTTQFYTAMYHSLMQPQTINDLDGRYLGADLELHKMDSPQKAVYGTFSGWDQYRAQIQLLGIVRPDVASDMAQSMLEFARQNDGSPGQCLGQRPALNSYLALRYAADDACHCWGGAAETLENSVADNSLAQWASRLGRPNVAKQLASRGDYWLNTFNPAVGYQAARMVNGSWQAPWSPETGDGFAQGSSAQYTWMVPQNVSGLAKAMGGRDVASTRLDAFFHDEAGQWAVKGGSALRFDPTNEPDIHTPWLYNALGKPWKTQETVRQVVDNAYGIGPKGLPGNDDLGTMSAWYVFASIGMFPQAPGRAEMLLASPVFTRIQIERSNGVTLRISANNTAPYVQSVRVDGAQATQSWLSESFLTRGGSVTFTLADAPNEIWGTSPSDLPQDH